MSERSASPVLQRNKSIDYLSDISDNPAESTDDRSLYSVLHDLHEEKNIVRVKNSILLKYKEYLYKTDKSKDEQIDVLEVKNKLLQFHIEPPRENFPRQRTFKTNQKALYEDMKETIDQFKRYIELVEEHAKMRKYRSITYSSGNWITYWNKEKMFQEILQSGVKIMEKFINTITMEPHAVAINRYTWWGDKNVQPKEYDDDKIKVLESVGYALLVRFARILEDEGVEHNLPVPPVIKKPKKFIKINETPEKSAEALATITRNESNVSLNNKTETLSDTTKMSVDKSELIPSDFLEILSQNYKLTLDYFEVPNKRNRISFEPIVACRLNKIGAESKGRNRQVAVEAASAKVLATILKKADKGKLPPELKHISEEEKELALNLACEYINYEEILSSMVAKMNTTKMPQYYPVFNIPKGQYAYRCKAVGFSSVGSGRTKEIAKRMGAKFVIDKIQEQREKNLISKYGEKKAKRLIEM